MVSDQEIPKQPLWKQLSLFFSAREHRIEVPTLGRGNVIALRALTELRAGLPNGVLRLILDFSKCGALSLAATVFLGGIASLVRARGGLVQVEAPTVRPDLRRAWEANGFLAHLGAASNTMVTDAVPFEHHATQNKSRVIKYLEAKWIGAGAVHLSNALQADIIGKVWEIYTNAFEHSGSPIGVINCGRYDKTKRQLHLCVMDFGLGIPDNVRRYRPDMRVDSGSAMKWAFQNGSSTKAEEVGYGRGLGLYILKEFIRLNKGKLEIYSNDGYVQIDAEREIYRRMSARLSGTLVNIAIQANQKFYCYTHEVANFQEPSSRRS